MLSSSTASITASAKASAGTGLIALEPRVLDNTPPKSNADNSLPAAAIGNVNDLDESYRNDGLRKMLRISGKCFAIVDSAARFVVMYLAGRTGAPAAADMYTNAGTFFEFDSLASSIA